MSDLQEVGPLNPWYTWIRGRQFEGTFPGDSQTGIWPISGARVAYGLGHVLQSEWSYDPPANPWPPIEPDGLDDLAKERRVNVYQRVRHLDDCKVVLANREPVVAAFEITDQWFGTSTGEIALPCSADSIIGSHGICLLRADEEKQRLVFVNSWGKDWGDRGFGYLPFSYFDEWIVSAWTTPTVSRQDEVTDFVQYLCLGYFTVLGDMVHVREIFDSQRDERLAWTIAVERPPFLEVEDCFVRPTYRGRGYGRELVEMLRKLGAERNLKLRVWLSHADEDGPIQRRLCASLGLAIEPSGVRWARYLATNEGMSRHPAIKPIMPTSWSPRNRT